MKGLAIHVFCQFSSIPPKLTTKKVPGCSLGAMNDTLCTNVDSAPFWKLVNIKAVYFTVLYQEIINMLTQFNLTLESYYHFQIC